MSATHALFRRIADSFGFTGADGRVSRLLPDPGGSTLDSRWPWFGRGRARKMRAQEQLGELARELHAHLEHQRSAAQRMGEALEQISGTLAGMRSAQERTATTLLDLAAKVDVGVKNTAGLAALSVELPATLHAQSEATRAIARQLDVSGEISSQLVHSLQSVAAAAGSLRDAQDAHGRDAAQRHAQAAASQQALQVALARQQHRLLVALTILAGAAVVASAAAVAVVVSRVL